MISILNAIDITPYVFLSQTSLFLFVTLDFLQFVLRQVRRSWRRGEQENAGESTLRSVIKQVLDGALDVAAASP
jgi:hypothetical protein